MAEGKDSERQAEPRLSQQLAELRQRLRAGTHQGEPFEVTATDRELEEAIAWYLEWRPSIPFRNSQVCIDPDGVEARGEVHLGTIQLPLSGRANVLLHDSLPVVTIERLEVGKAIQDATLKLAQRQQENGKHEQCIMSLEEILVEYPTARHKEEIKSTLRVSLKAFFEQKKQEDKLKG